MKELPIDNTDFYKLPEMSGIKETTERHGLGVVTGPIDHTGGTATVRTATSKVLAAPALNPSDSVHWNAEFKPPDGSDSTKMAETYPGETQNVA